MALRPRHCLALFARMSDSLRSSSWRIQGVEQGLRLLVGFAMIIRSADSKAPLAFEIAGWLLVATSAIILMVPISWHGAYGAWWAERLKPAAVRLLAPMPAAGGAILIYGAI
jgi:hypothetical protein